MRPPPVPHLSHSLFSRDFLTGFHKRKVAKADAARKKAQERDKRDRLEARRQVIGFLLLSLPVPDLSFQQRRALRDQAAENARMVESAYANIYQDNEQEWTGIASSSADKGKQRDEAYEDDQVLATVTVVEDFDPDALRHGRFNSSPPPPPILPPSNPRKKSTPPSKSNPPSSKKPKSQKIRYQTKEATKTERVRQLARRTEKAERAGGKAPRRNSSKKKSKSRG